MKLRKAKGLSQEDLSRIIDISRSSLAQIELGNRGIDILELHRLASILEFSVDAFLSNDFLEDDVEDDVVSAPVRKAKTGRPRAAFALQVNKLRNVVVYILERCAGKPNVGESMLSKLLYFADFNHYELYEAPITGATYRKIPFGPVVEKLDAILGQMVEKKILQRIKSQFSGYPQTRYIPLQKADLTELKASEMLVLDKVIYLMSDWSASALTYYSHKDTPWVVTKDGDEIDYGLVFYRELPFSQRNYGTGIESG